MKLLRIVIAIFLLGIVEYRVNATLADGSIAPDFTLTDIYGQSHHLYDYINQGKMVVLDFSASWCSTCWNYHNTGNLETFYNTYGPNGTDQVRVLYIEIDLATSVDCLYDINCPSSQGNWVTGTPYPLINLTSNQVSTAYNISGQPTIYSIGTGGYLLHDPVPSVATLTNNLNSIIEPPRLHAKLLLEGAYNVNTNTMNTNLLDNGLLTAAQPFNINPYNYNGEELMSTTSAITEWVLVEWRDKNNMDNVLQRKAGLLRNDGMLMDMDGQEGLLIGNLAADQYYIAFRTLRNLPIMTATSVSIPSDVLYDFSIAETQANGIGQLYEVEPSVYVAYTGDFDSNGVINALDYNLWRSDNAAVNIYVPYDADANGVVNNLDYNLWYKNRSKTAITVLQY
jgi:thiol-disulfide isomerase/thioredoxin